MGALARNEAARFLRFALVGGAGFFIDAAVLSALIHGLGVDPFSARLVSISAAALSTWRLNRVVTFGASETGQAREGMRYALVAALTAGLNYALYALALLVWPTLPPIAAMVGATAAAMLFSYVGYSRFAFEGAPGSPRTSLGAPRSQRR